MRYTVSLKCLYIDESGTPASLGTLLRNYDDKLGIYAIVYSRGGCDISLWHEVYACNVTYVPGIPRTYARQRDSTCLTMNGSYHLLQGYAIRRDIPWGVVIKADAIKNFASYFGALPFTKACKFKPCLQIAQLKDVSKLYGL